MSAEAQSSIPLAASVLANIGMVVLCIQLIPQAWQNWRRKTTEGVPAYMMAIIAISAVPFGVFAIVQNFNIPVQVQPNVFGTLAVLNWSQILVYTHKWSSWRACVVSIGFAVILAGIEVMFTLLFKVSR